MPRSAEAEWKGSLKEGKGRVKVGSGLFEGPYSFTSRFENGAGTNPEELIGAAHAGCFSMALAAALGKAGFNPSRIHTTAHVHLDKAGEGFVISKIHLTTEAEAAGIDEAEFQKHAEATKKTCPVSKALASVPIELDAKLLAPRM